MKVNTLKCDWVSLPTPWAENNCLENQTLNIKNDWVWRPTFHELKAIVYESQL